MCEWLLTILNNDEKNGNQKKCFPSLENQSAHENYLKIIQAHRGILLLKNTSQRKLNLRSLGETYVFILSQE